MCASMLGAPPCHSLRHSEPLFRVPRSRGVEVGYKDRLLPSPASRRGWRNGTKRVVRTVANSLAGSGASSEAVTSVPADNGQAIRIPPQDCTYGMHNIHWLSRELPRLLSIQKNPGDGLVLTRGLWGWELRKPTHYRLRGQMQFCNITKSFELFVPEVKATISLLSNGGLENIHSTVKVMPRHPGGKPSARDDGYWQAYITRAGESTFMEVVVDIQTIFEGSLKELQAVRLEVAYVSYGPHGRALHSQHVVLPLKYPEAPPQDVSLETAEQKEVVPIQTHLLSHMDDPLNVLQTYVLPYAKAGDVIAIAETPLAIMQGRFRHPQSVRPGLVAKLACLLFHPTSSLATACGMQSLVDISGRLRVVLAVMIAVAARLVGVRGMFYRLAGQQARLIDDVSGTLPPYDQFITLGPLHVKDTVDALKAKTGLDVAVVDVNDLKKVQILAASDGVDRKALRAALINNPAGNADEQTPIVLVRKTLVPESVPLLAEESLSSDEFLPTEEVQPTGELQPTGEIQFIIGESQPSAEFQPAEESEPAESEPTVESEPTDTERSRSSKEGKSQDIFISNQGKEPLASGN